MLLSRYRDTLGRGATLFTVGALFGGRARAATLCCERMDESEPRACEVDFADLFENAVVPLHWVAADGTILNANRAELELLGYDADEFIGRHIAEFHVDRHVIDDLLARLARNEAVRDYPARLRCKDGSIRHVLIDSNARWRDGQFLHTRCFSRDVTARKRAEDMLAAEHAAARILSEAAALAEAAPFLLRAVAETAGWAQGSVWLREGDVLVCAGAWRSGATAATPFAKIAPGETMSAGHGLAGRVLDSGVPAWERDDDGQTCGFPIELRGEVLGVLLFSGEAAAPPDDAVQRALVSIGRQVAQFVERRRVEEDRRREAEVLAAIARSVSASLDLAEILQTVAEGARELCGSDLSAIALREPEADAVVFRYRAGERYFRGARMTVQPGVGAGGHVLVTGRPLRSDDLVHDDRFASDPGYLAVVAQERIASVMVVPITIGGRVEGLLYVDNRAPRPFTDRDEDILLQLADHAAIAIRNAQLLAREQQARSEAEAANRMKDQFLATLSHELRTPLNAVLGWAVTLRSARLDEASAARALEAIERNARAQSQLIEDLLDISRIVTGKLRLDLRPVDPAAVVENALDAVRPAAHAKGLAIHSVLDPQAGPVSGDPDRLQQVVWNLVSNAVKFTPSGGRVDVRLQRAGDHVEIVVADTGRGIPADLLPHIFDRFRQADGESSRAQTGLGIGLALVKHLVELHGGGVEARSPGPGAGATFTVRLPRPARPQAAAAGARPGRHGEPALPVSSLLAGVRVVVVDDERDSAELFEQILVMNGAEVRRAGSAEEALEIVETWLPDVLVSDIAMPDEDGYSLIRRVRALPRERGGRVPAVALTAYGAVADRIRILSAGFHMHVVKPVEPAELVAVVANLAGRPLAPA